MKITFKKFKQLLKESFDFRYDKYEDILCEVFDVDDISEITENDYNNIIYAYKTNELNESDSALLEKAEELVINDAIENGYNIIAHHGTKKEFSEFKYGDIGFHLGTLEQARIAAKSHEYDYNQKGYHPKTIILNTAIRLQNPLIINNDPESWEPEELFYGARAVLDNYMDKYNLTTMDLDKIQEIVDADIKSKKLDIDKQNFINKDIRFLILYQKLHITLKEILTIVYGNEQKKLILDRLQALGYDGIKYLNLYEVDESSNQAQYSYIVLKANQIKNCEVISFKNGKVVTLEDRFDSSTNNLFETHRR